MHDADHVVERVFIDNDPVVRTRERGTEGLLERRVDLDAIDLGARRHQLASRDLAKSKGSTGNARLNLVHDASFLHASDQQTEFVDTVHHLVAARWFETEESQHPIANAIEHANGQTKNRLEELHRTRYGERGSLGPLQGQPLR